MRGESVLLLAAGRGRRAGGPKAWRPYGSSTLLEEQLSFLGGLAGLGGVFVSVQPGWEERCRALGRAAAWVACDPDAPPLASLRRLLEAAPARDAFVLHVDMPVHEPRVWEALSEAEGDAAPVCGGRRGHPVKLAAGSLPALAALDPSVGRLDGFLRARPVAEIPAGPAVLANLNGPAGALP